MAVLKGMLPPCGDAVPTWSRLDRARVRDCVRLRHRAQRGQALILAIIALLVLCIGVIVVFNTGQATSKKVQLINAADAAAYSAAVQQARAYNLIAYMNRASVANEVAAAQMVSWYSWMNFTLRGTDNFKDAVQAIAIIFDVSIVGSEVGAALQDVVTALNEVKTVVKTIRDGMQVAFSAGMTAIGAINKAYSLASYAIAKVDSQESLKLVPEIVKRNTAGEATIGARGYALLEEGALQAMSYSNHYQIPASSSGAAAGRYGADRYANVVMEARDGFSRKRSDGLGPLHKRGGTDLVNYRNWVGIDTLNVKVGWLSLDEPMAWGGAAAVIGTPTSFRSVASPGFGNGRGWDSQYELDPGHYDRYSGGIDNGEAGKMALSSPAMDGTDKAWLKDYAPDTDPGLQPYVDIKDNKATVPYEVDGESASAAGVKALDVGPVFTVLVEQPMKTVRTSTHVPGIGGQDSSSAFYVPDKAVADDMTALSSAQVYFDRPRGFGLFDSVTSPSSRELGNLFSPYWQARLVDTPCTVRQQVAIAYGAVAPCIPGKQ
ncbi:MAG TPA: pilus assembly protein TadG-related protein [Rhodanobacter sp.]|nr:pilus assembly protein TadG-related protein [Rhodanobacter sp.]